MVVPGKNHTEAKGALIPETPVPAEITPRHEAAPAVPEIAKSAEMSAEKKRDQTPAEISERPVIQPPSIPVPVLTAKDAFTTEIEDILSEDLTDLFLKMTPSEQEAFKQKGEETASKIRVMVAGAKFNIKKILALIRDWLKCIPGVNRFFLEQEAKIKTDKILLAAGEKKQQGRL